MGKRGNGKSEAANHFLIKRLASPNFYLLPFTFFVRVSSPYEGGPFLATIVRMLPNPATVSIALMSRLSKRGNAASRRRLSSAASDDDEDGHSWLLRGMIALNLS